MRHLHAGQCLDGLDTVVVQDEGGEGSKMYVGDFLHHCRPVVALYIIHHLHRRSVLTFH
jgi:hypothetical protein